MNWIFRCSNLHWRSTPAMHFQSHPSGKAALVCWAWRSLQGPALSRQSQQLRLGTLLCSHSKPHILEQLQMRQGNSGTRQPKNRQTLCGVGLSKPPKEPFGSFITQACKTHTPNKTWMQGCLQMEVAFWFHPFSPYNIYIFSSTFV